MRSAEIARTRLKMVEQVSRRKEFRGRALAIIVEGLQGFERRAEKVLPNLAETLAVRGVRVKVYTPMGLELEPACLIGKSPEEIDEMASRVDALSCAYVPILAHQIGIELVEMAPGRFKFQGKEGVKFNGCRIGKVVFTNGQFRKLFELAPQRLAAIIEDPAGRLAASIKKANKPSDAENCPMVGLSQAEAEGIAELLGLRLPTELEWERAAAFTDGNYFPYGDDYIELNKGGEGTISVFTDNGDVTPEGIRGLCNAFERTSSRYGEIDLSDPLNPQLPQTGNPVLRIGSWKIKKQHPPGVVARFGEGPRLRYGCVVVRFAQDL